MGRGLMKRQLIFDGKKRMNRKCDVRWDHRIRREKHMAQRQWALLNAILNRDLGGAIWFGFMGG